jgi:DNA invertase Pin-like site-specific DNA recombinase
MSNRKRLAVSYTRFSASGKQAKGDSEDRQERLFRQFCQLHNLTPAGEVYQDRGRSGFKDEHRKKGRLGQLIAAAKAGAFEAGTVVVVEAWDRLGRLRPDRQTELVAELVRAGVSVGVVRLNEIFSEEDFGTHKWTTLAVFIQLAFQESKQKAERVAASWERRRERARAEGKLPTTRLPAWVETVNGVPRLIPDRAATVRRIYGMAAEGYGHASIVTELSKPLNEGGAKPFGEVVVNEGYSRSQFSGHWTKPYVALILRDRRAVGDMQFNKVVGPFGEPDRQKEVKDGAPLAGFLPAAVTEEEYQLAKAGQESRRNRAKWSRERKYVNVFRSLLVHARDGQGFLLHNKGTSKAPFPVLINTSGNEGRGKSYTFPYHVFEEAVLSKLREVDPKSVMPRRDKDAPSRADVLRAALVNVRADITAIQADLRAGYSKALSDVLRDKEAEEERLATELQEELARSAVPAERAWEELPSLASLVEAAPDPDAARLRLRGVLGRVAEEALVLIVPRGATRLCVVQIRFRGGKCREYLIAHRTAGNRREETWSAGSLGDAAGAVPLDLRDKRHVRELERKLLVMRLEVQPGGE